MSLIDIMKANKQIVVLTLFVFAITVNLFRVSSPSVQESEAYASIFALLIPILGIVGYTLFTSGKHISFLLTIFATFIMFLYVVLTRRIDGYVMSILQGLLLISIITLAFASFNNLMGQYINQLGWRSRFIINLILYIPCLVSDFIAYMKKELALTPSVTFIIFGLEMMFITLYILLPKLLAISIKVSDGVSIIDTPIFLDTEVRPEFKAGLLTKLPRTNEIGTISSFNSNTPYTATIRSNYSISMWVYLNQQTHVSGESSNVFSYGIEGNEDKGAYPQIRYLRVCPKTGHDMFQIKLYVNDDGFELSVPNQKWNNFVFTFNNNTIDFFVNGNLEKTTHRDTQDVPTTTIVKVGSDNRIYGAICNVLYFDTPLPKNTITRTYNLLMKHNPPINNIV